VYNSVTKRNSLKDCIEIGKRIIKRISENNSCGEDVGYVIDYLRSKGYALP
jgi:hypothetical protein